MAKKVEEFQNRYPMHTFNLILHQELAIIKSGDITALIDTGAPFTLHGSNKITFAGCEFAAATQIMGVTAGSISEQLGYPITTLLGNDILSKFNILFDYKNLAIHFSNQPIEFHGTELPLNSEHPVPRLQAEIEGTPHTFFLDSGAGISYLNDDITKGRTADGAEQDFHPLAGKFTTDIYKIETEIEKQKFTVRYGNLPPALKPILTMGAVSGIIGSDFFKHFKVLLHAGQQKLSIKQSD